MTLTPEHDKVEALRAANPTAGNLAFVLLDSEQWTLSNSSVTPSIDIPVQSIVADLLGVDFAAYQEERRQALGLSRADASIAGSIHGWAATEPAPLYTVAAGASADVFNVFGDATFTIGDDTPAFPVTLEAETFEATPTTEIAHEAVAEVTDAEAALIAAIAQSDDDETPTAAETETVVKLPTIFDAPILAPVPHIIDEDDDDDATTDEVADAPAEPKSALIETGTYSLLDEEPSDTPTL